MTIRHRTSERSFNCPKCGPVTLTVDEILHYANEMDAPVDATIGRITDYGTCPVAQEIDELPPGTPLMPYWEKCPATKL